MLVTRKRNLVRNGRSKSPLGSVIKGDVSPKGINIQRGENIEGSSVKAIKERVFSSQPDHTHVVRDDSVEGIAPNGDLGNLEVRFSVSSSK